MKKVLSVVLAAAMVLGMSVSAFANKSWIAGGDDEVTDVKLSELSFANYMIVVRDGKSFTVNAGNTVDLVPGDDLYFDIMKDRTTYAGKIDADWSINIKGNEYVADAKFYKVGSTAKNFPWGPAVDDTNKNNRYVKVEIEDDLDEVSSETVKFELYLADNEHRDEVTERIKVKAKFANLGEQTVSYDWTNDTDEASIWKAPKGKAGTAVFDFSDGVFFTVKMISEEKVVLNLSQAYDKKIDKEYNEYDADLSFYNFKGSKDEFTKTGELFIPSSKDNKYIYEVVDGELVEVEATYDDSYKVGGISKTHKGYVIETKELGYYVVADDELIVEEVDDTTTAPSTPSTDKINPSTGANDFVGAAVALAVVSVAAAGALAFKK